VLTTTLRTGSLPLWSQRTDGCGAWPGFELSAGVVAVLPFGVGPSEVHAAPETATIAAVINPSAIRPSRMRGSVPNRLMTTCHPISHASASPAGGLTASAT
jgi:hypothetical protein